MGHGLMDFSFTDEQQMIAETAKDFFTENATSEQTRKAMAADGFDRDLWQALCGEVGLGGVLIAEEFGGAELGHVELATIAEAAGAQVAAIPLLGLAMASGAIGRGGSAEQKSELLPKIASGEIVVATGGSADVTCNGEKVTGTFNFVAHGGVADLFVLAYPSGAWLVEADAVGVTVQVHTTMDQTRPFATVTLDDAKGDPLLDWQAGLDAANHAGWVCLGAEALGGAQACLDRTVAYSQERVQFGRQIGSFQAYKHRLADMMVAIEQARSATYWAACAVDERTADMQLGLHSAKAFCGDTYFKCASDMIQLHGGIGFTWEHDAHLFFKRAKAIQEMNMNGDWHREQIARMVLGDAA